MSELEIFAAALEITDPVARSAYLDHACLNPERRRRIDSLLRRHETAGDFLEKPAVAALPPDVSVDAPASAGASRRRSATVGVESSAEDDDDPLDFLEPSTKPGSIGRLGHYEITEVLGRGGFGVVLKAFDEKLHRVVAVKALATRLAATSPARKRFLREARAAAAVKHENVVAIYAVEEKPVPHLVMEYVAGQTLQQRLDQEGPLDLAEVLRIGRQVAESLAAAHDRGLVHRDVKPANILLENGLEQKVKITDFGLARAADDASLTQSGVVAGTPLYMAPEQARGDAVDPRTDLFSLGSVLYTMVG
ncbi:MAG: serine/threonine-protein kinase, partial [Planctomycetia bacterium]